MEDAPKRQQKTERLSPPIDLGFGKVYLERTETECAIC
jgi:hypothetical protein